MHLLNRITNKMKLPTKRFSVVPLMIVILTGDLILQPRNQDRVNAAREKHQSQIDLLFDSLGVEYPPEKVLITAYKKEQILQLWVESKDRAEFLKAREYKFTAFSGKLGPKRKRGDLQIPEGFYHITRFNPRSQFHLSLRINYPNASDKILGSRRDPGGDILIHGEAVTIGCIPIGNEAIEELYLICLDTKNQGQNKIMVYIFPCQMDSLNMDSLKMIAGEDTGLWSFWQNLKQGYDIFMKNKQILKFHVNDKGKYLYDL
ncbi:MAG: L,D-transpeptidase family protein [candidate division WOR-3 bacterium]